MHIETKSLPEIYQYPHTGKPDDNLEIYIFDTYIDTYYQGRECWHYRDGDNIFVLLPNYQDAVIFDLITKTFKGE